MCLPGVRKDIPHDSPVNATEWLTESIDRGIRRSLKKRRYSDVIDYLIQRAMVPAFVEPECDNAPWVFMHGNLRYDNILVDENYNIQGYAVSKSPLLYRGTAKVK